MKMYIDIFFDEFAIELVHLNGFLKNIFPSRDIRYHMPLPRCKEEKNGGKGERRGEREKK